MIRKINKIFRKFFEQDVWRIGIVNLDLSEVIERNISESDIKWLNMTSKDYEADPFIFECNNQKFIAYEIFDYLHGNGKIKCVTLDGQSHDEMFSELNAVKGHKSFPFTFEENGNLYCIPETSDLNEISLYKFNQPKGKFVKLGNLMQGEGYIDSCIKQIDGMYYLFTSTASEPYKQRLFYSSELLGKYVEHPRSPVANSIEHGRNAGGIIDCRLGLFRVSQNCINGYGSKIHIMKISEITPTTYSENLVNIITPTRHDLTGIHTFSSWGNVSVIDAKKSITKKRNLFRKSIFKLLKLLKLEINYK
ncbi:hypothetical protein V4V57_004097, partial [Vibrio mimicus]